VSVAVLTPFTGDDGTQASGRWRKKLLPIGEINYKGRVLKFTRDYLAGLVDSFQRRAYDQVPFQLADSANTHTNDVERTGGQITDMSLEPDGLWIELQPTERGARVLADNPGVGVSARIVEQYERSDGEHFPRAVQHVLCTLDPRIPGMGGWEAVAASNDAAEITIDLSGEHFTGTEISMPELTKDQQDKLAQLLDLDPAKLAALVASQEGGGISPEAVAALDGDADADDAEAAEVARWIDGLTDDQLAELEAELEAEDGEREPEPAALSGEDASAVELAQATGDEALRQLAIVNGQLDSERWQNERRKLVAAGTPPFIADLAQPLLEGAGHVVDLANGKSVDAGLIVRKILTEFQKLGQQLGLGIELGTEADEPEDTTVEDSRNDVVTRAKAQLFGIRS